MADLTKKDLESLSSKLGKYSEELPTQEKEVLDWVASELADADLEDVAGGDSVSVSGTWSRGKAV